MQYHDQTLHQRQLAEEDRIAQNSNERHGPVDHGQMPALDGVVGVCENSQSANLLRGGVGHGGHADLPAEHTEPADAE